MDLMHSLIGTYQVEIVSADIPSLIAALNRSGMSLYCVNQLDMLTIRVQILRKHYPDLEKLVLGSGSTVQILSHKGAYWHLRNLVQRPVLITGVMLLLLLAMYLPGRVFFVHVAGNQALSARKILEIAEECGVSFGANRRQVRSEAVKNKLLSAIPQLQWAGVNTYGCTAVISVVERAETKMEDSSGIVSSIVASRDGIIESVTVTKGTALCKKGQAVKAGQVLISGYTDCGMTIRASCAEGEVYALTKHDLTVVSPTNYRQKGSIAKIDKRIGIKIGKNKINLLKDSGILECSCDKMYTEYYLSLPGGFRLPVAITVLTVITYDDFVGTSVLEVDAQDMDEYASSYLKAHMIGGTILSGSVQNGTSNGVFYLHGEYACKEIIGQLQKEENIGYHGKTD